MPQRARLATKIAYEACVPPRELRPEIPHRPGEGCAALPGKEGGRSIPDVTALAKALGSSQRPLSGAQQLDGQSTVADRAAEPDSASHRGETPPAPVSNRAAAAALLACCRPGDERVRPQRGSGPGGRRRFASVSLSGSAVSLFGVTGRHGHVRLNRRAAAPGPSPAVDVHAHPRTTSNAQQRCRAARFETGAGAFHSMGGRVWFGSSICNGH